MTGYRVRLRRQREPGGTPIVAGQAAAFAALARDGTVVTVPDSAHNVQGDNPAGLLAAIRPFLDRHRAEAAR